MEVGFATEQVDCLQTRHRSTPRERAKYKQDTSLPIKLTENVKVLIKRTLRLSKLLVVTMPQKKALQITPK